MENNKLDADPCILATTGHGIIHADPSPSMTLSKRRSHRPIEGDGFEPDEMRSAVVGNPTRIPGMVANPAGSDTTCEFSVNDSKKTGSGIGGDETNGDIVDEIENVPSGDGAKEKRTLSGVLTYDDCVLVPEQLDDDPVPSMSEDSLNEDAPEREREQRTKKRTRSQKKSTVTSDSDKVHSKNAKRSRKKYQQSNTLYRLWKSPASLINPSPVGLVNDSAASGPSSPSTMSPEPPYEPSMPRTPSQTAHRVVKLKAPRSFLKELQVPSPSSSIRTELQERPVDRSPDKKKPRTKVFTLISDDEDDISRSIAKRQTAYCDNAVPAVVTLSGQSVSPPTPPKSNDSGDEDDASTSAITKSIADPDKVGQEVSGGVMSGSDSVASTLDVNRVERKRPIHPFFLKKKTGSTIHIDISAELSATDEDLSTDAQSGNARNNDGAVYRNDIKRPIHPFFLGAKAKLSTKNLLDDNLQQSDTSGYDTDVVNASSKEKKDSRQSSGASIAHRSFSHTMLPDWPSRANRHVIYKDDARDESLLQSRKDTSYSHSRSRKFKATAVGIAKSEDVVRKRLSGLSLDDKSAGKDKLIPFPIRHVLKPGEVQVLALQHVDVTRHPYLQYLYRERLPHQCAFDRADFEDQMWSAKYAPQRSIDVAVVDDSALLVRKWLSARMDGAVDRSKVLRIGWMKSMQRRQKQDDLDGFICFDEDDGTKIEIDPISSSEDDYDPSSLPTMTYNADRGSSTDDDQETVGGYQRRKTRRSNRRKKPEGQHRVSRLRPKSERPSRHSNVLTLTGPTSSFKTSSVYAAAAELGLFVFEIHAGQKRSGKDIFDQVGEMSQSHLVHHKSSGPYDQDAPVFKQKSLVLVEDVDTIYEEDKAFWSSLIKFIETSKRPVILTCTDKSLVPVELLDANPGSLIEFSPCNLDIKTDLIWMISLCEGHLLPTPDVRELLESLNGDLRAALAQLQFWCQMAVGDERKGLSWVLVHSRDEKQEDVRGTRVISENTFTRELLRQGVDSGLTIHDPNNDAVREAQTGSLTNLKSLDTIYELLSSADLWRSGMHTVYEVPLVADSDELIADQWQSRDMTVGCPIVASELQRVVEAFDYELCMSDTVECFAQSILDSQGLGINVLGDGYVH
ncbi:hypothetical protein V1525DRAFT_407015 [Lipomyces kononenkoae]|uniref:Uncharacterized protein n=1 Tax=Lipomyces kononenkoae TaxID=34357 RepID=A0ACC3SXP9_LIPKO